MEYGRAAPFHLTGTSDRNAEARATPSDFGRFQANAGTVAFGPHTFVKASWRDVPSRIRDDLRALRLWLQKDLGVLFDIDYWREERDPLNARMSSVLDTVRDLAKPYTESRVGRDYVKWAGQVTTRHPDSVRLNIATPEEHMLNVLAHEARHVWQLENADTFFQAGSVKHGVTEDLRDFMEFDASRYADRAVARWRREARR